MLVFSLDQRFERASHWLIDVDVNHNSGMTLYAPSQNEERKVH